MTDIGPKMPPEPRHGHAPSRGVGGLLARFWWVAGLLIAAVIVVVLAPLASPDPDGLESVAQTYGFLAAARDAPYKLIPDYAIPGLEGNVSTILAGLIGVGIVFSLVMLLGRMLARRRRSSVDPGS